MTIPTPIQLCFFASILLINLYVVYWSGLGCAVPYECCLLFVSIIMHVMYSLVLDHPALHCTALHVMWCGVVWCGVVWCGVVWCGVWCGVVWCGVV